jgi:hypothetical protein
MLVKDEAIVAPKYYTVEAFKGLKVSRSLFLSVKGLTQFCAHAVLPKKKEIYQRNPGKLYDRSWGIMDTGQHSQ